MYPQISGNKRCGSNLPTEIRSLQNNLYLRFKTDRSVTGRGFKAFYNSVPAGKFQTEH